MDEFHPNSDEYYESLNSVVNFFRRTKHGALLFCSLSDFAYLRQINKTLRRRLNDYGIQLTVGRLNRTKKLTIVGQIESLRKNNPAANGLVLSNVGAYLSSSGKSAIYDLNFARESLLELDIPILIWLSGKEISLFANEAPDIFSVRAKSVVHFHFAPSQNTGSSEDNFDYLESKEALSQKKLKVKLLSKQLKEATQKDYPKNRIFKDIVIDLVRKYLGIKDIKNAERLFLEFRDYFVKDDSLPIFLIEITGFYLENNQLNEVRKIIKEFNIDLVIDEQSGKSVFEFTRKLLQTLIDNSVSPDVISFTTLLSKARTLEEGMGVISMMEAYSISPDVIFFTTLLSKARTLDEGMEVISLMEVYLVPPDVIFFTTLLSKVTTFDEGREVISLMDASSVLPDVIFLNTLLSKTRTFEGDMEVISMIKDYGFYLHKAIFHKLISFASKFSNAKKYFTLMRHIGISEDETAIYTLLKKVKTIHDAKDFFYLMKEYKIDLTSHMIAKLIENSNALDEMTDFLEKAHY